MKVLVEGSISQTSLMNAFFSVEHLIFFSCFSQLLSLSLYFLANELQIIEWVTSRITIFRIFHFTTPLCIPISVRLSVLAFNPGVQLAKQKTECSIFFVTKLLQRDMQKYYSSGNYVFIKTIKKKKKKCLRIRLYIKSSINFKVFEF